MGFFSIHFWLNVITNLSQGRVSCPYSQQHPNHVSMWCLVKPTWIFKWLCDQKVFPIWKNAALKATLPLPPNFISGKEGESAQVWAPDSQDRIFWGRKDWMDWGWSWGWGLPDRTEISAAGDGTLLLSHLSSAMQVLSRRCIPNCFDHSSGDDQCLSHPLIKMLLDSRFPRLLHIL